MEIMVAIAIFSMLVAAIYSTWMVILKSSQVGQEAAAQIQRQRIAVRTIEDSLTCIQSFQASMKYYIFVVQNGDQPMLSFTARLPEIFPRNGRFGDFNLRRLTFTVEARAGFGKGSGAAPESDSHGHGPDEQSNPLVLARNVKDFAVECWDTNNGWATEWHDTNSIPPLCASPSCSAATLFRRRGPPCPLRIVAAVQHDAGRRAKPGAVPAHHRHHHPSNPVMKFSPPQFRPASRSSW